MKSHEYADQLKKLAEALLSAPDIFLNCSANAPSIIMSFWTDKQKFLDVVRALGTAGEKDFATSKNTMYFTPAAFPFVFMSIERSAVCRKIQEEKWECEPLLSEEEILVVTTE